MSTPQEVMFDEALSAVHSGDRARAKDLFTRLLKTGQENPEYWIWMSAVVETAKERTFCLKEALRVDPQNVTARRGLTVLGVLPPEKSQIFPARYQRRSWQSRLAGVGAADSSAEKAPPKAQFALMGGAFLVVVGLIAFAFWGIQQQANRPHRAPIIVVPTNTAVSAAEISPTRGTPTAAPLRASGSPTPLWMLLKATYTPTPLYLNTPHPVFEDFSIGMRAFQRGEWERAATSFQQVIKLAPDALDVLYYLGESYRQEKNYTQALQAYNQAIKQNPDFAPAYLGRARTTLAMNPKSTEAALKDFQAAIEKDPNFGEAYLGLAEMQVQSAAPKNALDTLDQAAVLLPNSPLIYLYRAQTYLALNDPKQSLEYARKANALDLTLVDAYYMIGAGLQSQADLSGSFDPLLTYVTYVTDNAQAWTMLAKAYNDRGDPKNAKKALDKSLQLDNHQADAFLLRAQILLKQNDADNAIADFRAAFRADSSSYEASLGIGESLMMLKYPGDGYEQFERTKALAKTDLQKAEILYWTAQSLEKLGELEVAMRDYQALVAMPKASVKPEWLQYAKDRISALVTLTPTPLPKTATPTASPTQTHQPTKTSTPTPTVRPSATSTGTPATQLTATRQP